MEELSTTLLEEAAEALALRDPDARAARLLVVAHKLFATGDHAAAERARALVAEAAERVPAAALLLGGMLLLDGGAAEGVRWLRRAAAAGEASAFFLLGAAALRGVGEPVDAQKARLYIQAAAEAGVTAAAVELAALYDAGIGGARDAKAAERWERAAARAGDALGCLRLATRLAAQSGGVPLALPWFERAADLGSADAAARLARYYLRGDELPYDAEAADYWMERARALGFIWK